ncbi:hypothetical protein ACOL3H_06975 [Aliarcobacter butzleri]
MANTKTKLTLDSQVLNHLFVGVDFNNTSEVENRLREITLRASLLLGINIEDVECKIGYTVAYYYHDTQRGYHDIICFGELEEKDTPFVKEPTCFFAINFTMDSQVYEKLDDSFFQMIQGFNISKDKDIVLHSNVFKNDEFKQLLYEEIKRKKIKINIFDYKKLD